jgi:hypothetical protein
MDQRSSIHTIQDDEKLSRRTLLKKVHGNLRGHSGLSDGRASKNKSSSKELQSALLVIGESK